jgi:hypothetical protein
MGKAKFSKKLVLNKETISNLNNASMNNVKGGATYSCNSANVTCCQASALSADVTCCQPSGNTTIVICCHTKGYDCDSIKVCYE